MIPASSHEMAMKRPADMTMKAVASRQPSTVPASSAEFPLASTMVDASRAVVARERSGGRLRRRVLPVQHSAQ